MGTETIILVEENDSEFETIDLENENCNKLKNKIKLACMEDKINPLLSRFVRRCLKLDQDSQPMLKSLNLIINYYNKSNEAYRTSQKFKKVLNRALKYLKIKPEHKFTHIKMIYDSLKFYTTLKKVYHKYDANILTYEQPNNSTYLDKNEDIIEIDDNVINHRTERDIDESSSNNENSMSIKDRISFEDSDLKVENNSDELNINKNPRLIINKENENIINLNSSDEEIESFDCNETNINSLKLEEMHTQILRDKNTPSLLVPIKWTNIEEVPVEDKIKQIENLIATYKKKIAHYEVKEVCAETKKSPYLITSKLKSKVVTLYKEICKLKDETPVKQKVIRLKVSEGCPSGPAKRLEELMNNNHEDNGNLLFPDFNDVLSCVISANSTDNLGWSRETVLNEAQALFEQCGHALQQYRQKRDWSDIISNISKEELEEDPADRDPELLAKLNKNKELALSRENYIFERYSRMQANTSITMHIQESDSEDEMRLQDELSEEFPAKRIKLERVDHSAIFGSSLVIEISDSSSDDE